MEQIKGLIFDLKPFAVHDGDGIRTTVFFKGCSLKCVWCHNPEGISFAPRLAFYKNKCTGCGRCAAVCSCHHADGGVHLFDRARCVGCGKCEDACPNGAMKIYGKAYTVDELMPLLLADRDFYEDGGGVTLSGGECLCQPDFCRALLAACKQQGLNTAVDTCGNVPWESIEAVLPYTDTFLYDVKAVDGETHLRCTGSSNERILANLRRLDACGASIEIRVPYVPGMNAGDIKNVAEFVNGLKNVKKVRVLPYHNYASGKYAALDLPDTLPGDLPDAEEIEQAQNLFRVTGR